MKVILKPILKYHLKYLAKLALFIHKPVVVAVAGSTNKYFTRQSIKKILEEACLFPGSCEKNFNTEIGLPLAILGLPSGYNSYKKWLPIIKEAPLAAIRKDFPKILILELGVSDPGDMKYLLSIVRPQVVVVTEITQRYLEGFADMDNLVSEYEFLLNSLDQKDLCVLNYDNSKIRNIAKQCQAKIISFGFSKGVDYQIQNTKQKDGGQEIIINFNNNIKNYFIPKFGKHHIYSFTAALIIKNYATKIFASKN